MKESAKTATLLILSILLLFLATKVWVRFPEFDFGHESEVPEFSSTSLEREILSPKKIIVNFSGGEHTLFYDMEPRWTEYFRWMKDILSIISREDNQVEKISYDEYLKAQDEMSLIFVYDHPWSTGILRNLLDVEKPDERANSSFRIRSLYIPVAGRYLIIIGDNDELYKIHIDHGKFKEIAAEVEDLYDSKRYRNYENIWEKHGIPRAVYVPKLIATPPPKVIYRNELARLEKPYQNDLAERFLGRDIDYIREIIEDSGTTYVYEARNLRFNDDGLLEYQNLEEFESKEANLFISLRTALEFISTRTGMTSGLTLAKTERIDDERGNAGFRMSFNMKENSQEVLLQDDPMDYYLVIDVYNQNVKKLKFLYRKAVDTEEPRDPAAPILEDQTFSPAGVLEQNVPMFYPDGVPEGKDPMPELIGRITEIDSVYVDPGRKEDVCELLPAWRITMGDTSYIYHMGNGEFLMER